MKHIESFYIPPPQIKGDQIEIKGDELKHLITVCRKKQWDVIQVVDGLGNTYTAVLRQVDSRSAIAEIQKKSRFVGEPTFKLTLAHAVPKGDRFEWVIEKGTEIGVMKFIPLIAEKSIVRAGESRQFRWKNIAIAAMKQCHRSTLPEISSPMTFDEILQSTAIHDFQLIAHPEQNPKSLADIISLSRIQATRIPKLKSGIIMIGPEGGFTDDEIRMAKSHQYQTFSLGGRRLRSETAGVIASAILIELTDNWK